MTDVLSALRQIKWRGIAFPIANLKTDIQQNNVTHSMPDVDADRIESTGRKSITTSGRALFRNTGTVFEPRAYSEPLYPNVHAAFLSAMADRTTGDLIHPELGLLRCKPNGCTTNLTAEMRDGADVDCAWIETLDDDDLNVFGGVAEALSEMPAAAEELDAELVRLRNFGFVLRHLISANAPVSMRRIQTFSEMVAPLARAAGTLGATSKQLAGSASSLLAAVASTKRALTGARSSKTNRATEIAERLEAATRQYVTGGRRTLLYIVPDAGTTTLGAVAARLGASADDLLRLNPRLAASARVVEGALVRYFA